MNKKRRVVLVVLVFGILLCACSDKNLEISEKRKAESSDENKEAYEKGYHLPIKKEEREKAEKDSIAALKLVQDIYAEADKGDTQKRDGLLMNCVYRNRRKYQKLWMEVV